MIWLILAIFFPANAECVTLTRIDDSVQSYYTLNVATAAVSATSTLIISSDSRRVGMIICNECTADVRVGPQSVTADIGLMIESKRCATLDIPRYFRGALWGITVLGGTCKVSALQALP